MPTSKIKPPKLILRHLYDKIWFKNNPPYGRGKHLQAIMAFIECPTLIIEQAVINENNRKSPHSNMDFVVTRVLVWVHTTKLFHQYTNMIYVMHKTFSTLNIFCYSNSKLNPTALESTEIPYAAKHLWGETFVVFTDFSLTMNVFPCVFCSINECMHTHYHSTLKANDWLKMSLQTEPQTNTIRTTALWTIIPFFFTFLTRTHNSFKAKKSLLPDPEGSLSIHVSTAQGMHWRGKDFSILNDNQLNKR